MGSAADSFLGAIASHTEAPSLSSPPLYRMLLILWFVKTQTTVPRNAISTEASEK
jgi:hypothetical protein